MYPLRSIAFVSELIYAPRKHPLERLHEVHREGFRRYANFQVIQGGAQLSNPPVTPGAISAATILPDRLRVQEHMTGISREDFPLRLRETAAQTLEHLEVTGFLAQQFVVQSLVNPRFFQDSNEFMTRATLNLSEGQLDAFGRKPRLVGLRFSFPSTRPQEPLYNVRIESYQNDPRSLFIENVAVFRLGIQREQLPVLDRMFAETYQFVESKVLDFVAQIDARGESARGD